MAYWCQNRSWRLHSDASVQVIVPNFFAPMTAARRMAALEARRAALIRRLEDSGR